jgi:hypothetical protein
MIVERYGVVIRPGVRGRPVLVGRRPVVMVGMIVADVLVHVRRRQGRR